VDGDIRAAIVERGKLLAQIKATAEKGEPESQSRLGSIYFTGELGVLKDRQKANEWFRKAADQGDAGAQCVLGSNYDYGEGVEKDPKEAVKWYSKAAEQGFAIAQYNLGVHYNDGNGVKKDNPEAVNWYRKAAQQGLASAQFNLGSCYFNGEGIGKDDTEAAKWFLKAAEQGDVGAQFSIGLCCATGNGTPKDYVEAYKWCNLSAARGDEQAKRLLGDLEKSMTRNQIAEGQQLAREFKPRKAPASGSDASRSSIIASRPEFSGTGFFISEYGYFVTSGHVVRDSGPIRLVTSAGLISAKVVKVDAANDLALLKAEGSFSSLPVAASRGVKLGCTVATVGFPNIGLQGFAPKLAKGEIASLSGAGDDARYFQISVPVQPGNSGGALVDERGNVLGVVSAKLSARAALASSGALPENVNYAVKSSYLLSFLESVPEVSAKLKEVSTKEMKFEDVVKAAEHAAVLVLVY
jgi:TPR repeat protein